MSGNPSVRMHHILSVTNNRSLAHVRELVLMSFGFVVQSRDRWSIRHASLHGFDLVIICHTVNDLEVERIKDRLKRCGSKAPILRLTLESVSSVRHSVDERKIPSWALVAQFLIRWKPVETAQRQAFTMPQFLFRAPTPTLMEPITEYLDTVASIVQAGH
jgi:hypothetical protein